MGAPQYEQAGADIGGTGTTGTIPVWTAPSTLGDSLLSQSGAIVTNSGTFRAANGTFTEPAYTFSASSGTGMYRATSGALLRFAVSGAYAFGVDTNGNFGINTATPNKKFQVLDGNSAEVRFTTTGNSVGNTITQRFSSNASSSAYESGGAYVQAIQGAGIDVWSLAFGTANASATAQERARIDSAGNLLVRQRSNSANNAVAFDNTVQNALTVDSGGNIYGTSGTTGMTNGFFYIPAAAGAPTGVPTAVAGRVPMYYDTTNNQFYVYNGGWKKVTLA